MCTVATAFFSYIYSCTFTCTLDVYFILFDTCACRYMASSDRCKKAEETIERETEQVKKYKQLVDEKFQEVCQYCTFHSCGMNNQLTLLH